MAVAHLYIENWIIIAEQQGVILLVPVFDPENFGGPDSPLGGYRGLMGRRVEADAFVLRLVDRYQQLFGSTDLSFYLYGHSAGGQFVSRFIVKHPDRVKRAVISAAATYPYPSSDVAWPYGMGELHTTVRWTEADPEINLDIQPDPEKWLAAATLPVTVIVGLNDLEPHPDRPGQQGNTRPVIARNWVRAMNAFAAQHSRQGAIKLSMIPGLGHSATKLLSYCEEALFSAF